MYHNALAVSHLIEQTIDAACKPSSIWCRTNLGAEPLLWKSQAARQPRISLRPLDQRRAVAGCGREQLLELDDDLTNLHGVARRYPHVFHFSRAVCCNIGFHLHGFQDRKSVV